MKTVGVTDYINQTPPNAFQMEKISLSITPEMRNYRLHKPETPYVYYGKKSIKFKTPKNHFNEKKIMKYVQNGRCISSICEQSLCKV